MAEEKTIVDVAKDLRRDMNNSLAVQANHLCIRSMRDVAIVVGALGAGLVAGRIAAFGLQGKWRIAPFAIGGACLLAARFVPSEQLRFVTRSSMVVGGSALMLSMVHFTLQAALEEARTMEA